jgi:hypothetical protein
MTLLQRAEDIAAELKTRLLRCTVEQGAETDIGASVFLGRRSIDKSQIPCVVILEGDDVTERVSQRTDYQIEQRYALLAYLPCTVDDPNTAAHAAIRDLKRAVFTTGGRPDHQLNGQVKRVEYLGRDIGPRSDGEAIVLAIIEIGVQYVENVATP